MPLKVLDALSRVITTYDQPDVIIRIERGRFRCESWQTQSDQIVTHRLAQRLVDFPIDARIIDVLSTASKHTPKEIKESGLTGRVLAAQEAATGLIDAAHAQLEELGVTRNQIQSLVNESVKRRAAAGRGK